jgi:hypothetical protein
MNKRVKQKNDESYFKIEKGVLLLFGDDLKRASEPPTEPPTEPSSEPFQNIISTLPK